MTASQNISVKIAGAGILGLWQALTLARAGFRVSVYEASPAPFIKSASRYAGAMLAPDCEAEAAPDIVRTLGHAGIKIWRDVYPDVINAGSLVVASARDLSELQRFQNQTEGAETIDTKSIAELEPDLSGRFSTALFFADEAHVVTPDAMAFLLAEAQAAGAEFHFGTNFDPGERSSGDVVIDCRGLAARTQLPNLRGVRGERLLIKTDEVTLSRPVRLLHPRHPLYVVPWGEGQYMVGATVIESEDTGPATVRSVLELLGLVYALNPAFGEAEIIDVSAGVRPAFIDNVPAVEVHGSGQYIHVNGAYRHGFLLAPVLAEVVLDVLTKQGRDIVHPLLRTVEQAE